MVPALVRFAAALRREGIRPSAAELLDAVRAFDAVDLARRDAVRAALRATLVKRRADRPTFDRVFDAFFVAPARAGERRGERAEGGGGDARRSVAGGGRGTPRARPEEDDRPSHRPSPRPRREEPSRTDARAGRLRSSPDPRRSAERERARAITVAQAQDPLRRDLTRPMPTEEERRLAQLVPVLIQTLRARPSRRLRRARRGRLWARQVFRENVSRGGVPFVLPQRRVRLRRTRVVLLVDVSFSAARAAGYFLWMASAFLRMGRGARVLLFVDRPVDATAEVRAWMRSGAAGPPPRSRPGRPRPGDGIAPHGRSFAAMLEAVPGLNLDAPSDYGRAFHALLRSPRRPTGRGTVLVVLGDGRTNRFDPLPWALEEISRRCGSVLWLVPEPVSRWGTADSALPVYLPSADVAVEATDLEGLARGVRALLRSL